MKMDVRTALIRKCVGEDVDLMFFAETFRELDYIPPMAKSACVVVDDKGNLHDLWDSISTLSSASNTANEALPKSMPRS